MNYGDLLVAIRDRGIGPVIERLRPHLDQLTDEQRIRLFVMGLRKYGSRNSDDLSVILDDYPNLFRDVCEKILPDVSIRPIFEAIPPDATIPGVSKEDYKEWYKNFCERGIPLRPMEIKYVSQKPLPWYHQLCMVALQTNPESIGEIPKKVLRGPGFAGLVASSSYQLNLNDYLLDEEEYDFEPYVVEFLNSVKGARALAVATGKETRNGIVTYRHSLHEMPPELTGRISEHLAGSRRPKTKKRRRYRK
jgi:hypothetical protein